MFDRYKEFDFFVSENINLDPETKKKYDQKELKSLSDLVNIAKWFMANILRDVFLIKYKNRFTYTLSDNPNNNPECKIIEKLWDICSCWENRHCTLEEIKEKAKNFLFDEYINFGILIEKNTILGIFYPEIYGSEEKENYYE